MLFYLFITILIFIVVASFAIDSKGYLQEAMKSRPIDATKSLEDSFCRFYDSNESATNQDNACGKLTRGNCMNTKCCVWGKKGNTNKCYAGGATGPTFKSDNKGNKLDIDSYYYMNKCYGNCLDNN
jgi:hypothetical protein